MDAGHGQACLQSHAENFRNTYIVSIHVFVGLPDMPFSL